MSAWIATREHLDLLLTAAREWNLALREHADAAGRILRKENLASIAYQYPSDRDSRRPSPIGFRDRDVDTYRIVPYPGRGAPEVVAVTAGSLTYPSYEHPTGPPARTTGARQARLACPPTCRAIAPFTERWMVRSAPGGFHPGS